MKSANTLMIRTNILPKIIFLSLLFFGPLRGTAQANQTYGQRIAELLKELKSGQKDSFEIYLGIANAYTNVHNDSALVFIEYATDLASTKNSQQSFDILAVRERYKAMKREFSATVLLNHQKIKIARKLATVHPLFQSYFSMGSSFVSMRKIDSAEVYFTKAKELVPKIATDEFDLLGQYHSALGIFHSRQQELDTAMDNYTVALDYFEKAQNIYRIGNIHNSIGVTFLKNNRFRKAIESFKKALEYGKAGASNLQNYLSNINMSACYYNLADLDVSLQCALKAKIYAEKMDNSDYLATTYDTLAALYADLNEPAKAVMYNYRALDIYGKSKNYEGYVFTLQNLALANIRMERLDKARVHAEKALEISKKQRIVVEQPYIFDLISTLDSMQGRPQEALKNYKLSIRIADSIKNERTNANINKLQVEYRTLEKEKEIQKLNTQNKAKELSLVRKRFQNYALTGALIFALVIAGGLYSRFKTKGKLNKELALKNQDLMEKRALLENALAEREVLIREIHHRVKNNLQLITSMLNLQGEHTGDGEINQFLKRSQARIASMALVHRTLYNSRTPGTINLKNYLNELINAIFDSFDFGTRKITYEVQSEDTILDIDTTINLGIVVNELIYNSFKHAFKNRESGHLNIRVRKEKEQLKILISDDGIGISLPLETKKNDSFGLTLATLLMQQLEGTFDINSDEKGTQIVMTVMIPNSSD